MTAFCEGSNGVGFLDDRWANVALVLRQETEKKYPQIAELAGPLSEKLTNEVLLKLNAEIDVEGREPADVAYEWLKKEGFVTDK